MREYWLNITPESHTRATQADKVHFYIFASLYNNPDRTPEQEAELKHRIKEYRRSYDRFRQLLRYNDYKHRLLEECILKGFWLRNSGMQITFYIPCSPSWRPGKKDKFHLQPHSFKPDTDNLEKAMFDILKPKQDHAIWHIGDVKKLWVNEPQGCIHIICQDEPTQELRDPRQLKLRFRYK